MQLKVLFFEPKSGFCWQKPFCIFKHPSSCILVFFSFWTRISSIHLVPLDRFLVTDGFLPALNLNFFLLTVTSVKRNSFIYTEVASETLKVLQSFIRSGVKWFMYLYFCVMLSEQRKKGKWNTNLKTHLVNTKTVQRQATALFYPLNRIQNISL